MSVRLKSGRSPVRSRPWPPKFVPNAAGTVLGDYTVVTTIYANDLATDANQTPGEVSSG